MSVIADTIAELGSGGEGVVEELSRPRTANERPEERLLRLGLLDDRDLALEISMKSGRAYTGLRGVEHDARLFSYLPLALAESENVMPLIIVGNRLTVASAFADPDLSMVHRRFPGLEIELVITPYEEVRAAIGAALEGSE